ncbi:MAG: hypothetical protein M3159_01840 [Actinomycetota bacterium]|nr:hypothetical protein [Actinomycetota bacterium]
MRRQPPVPRAILTEWWWPPSPTVYRTVPMGYSSFENLLVPEVDPAPGSDYLWAHGFKLVEGGAGHVGFQTTGGDKRAVFLIDGGTAAAGNGNGNGSSVSFPWIAGREYALRVWTNEPGWWSALVQDQSDGREVEIGRILVPQHWRKLTSWSVMSTEYLGAPLISCDGLPRSSVLFGEPTANEGRVTPERSSHRLGEGTCDTSWVEPVGEGVRHKMGSG